MNWNFFESKVCVTTLDEQWLLAQRELARVGLSVEKFQSLPDIGPHQSFSKSVRQILIDFYESDSRTLLHLEDDVVFKNLNPLAHALRELPADWDIIYLGANLICTNNGEARPARYSKHLFRISTAWTTHAVGYNKKCIEHLLLHQPGFSEIMFDNWLSTQLPNLNAFVVAPMVAYQRAHRSLIWDSDEQDYTHIFEASQERLR